MGQLSLDELGERVERLERQVVLGKKAGMVVALAPASWVVFGSGLVKPPHQIVAQKFVLKDAKGTVRAGLGFRMDGAPELVMYDSSGKRIVSMQTAADDTGSLDFYDHDNLRMSLSSSPGGSSVMHLMDRKGRSATSLYMWPDSTTGLGFRTGESQVDMRIAPHGPARLSFADRDGKEIAGLGADSTQLSSRTIAGPVKSDKARHVSRSAGSGSGILGRTWFAP